MEMTGDGARRNQPHLPECYDFRDGKMYPEPTPGLGVTLDTKPLQLQAEITKRFRLTPIYRAPGRLHHQLVMMLRVVAAVIERDGLILIGQRPPGKSHALEWEFPGGKVEPGESPRAALARELREELEIEAHIGREMTRYRFTYRSASPARTDLL